MAAAPESPLFGARSILQSQLLTSEVRFVSGPVSDRFVSTSAVIRITFMLIITIITLLIIIRLIEIIKLKLLGGRGHCSCTLVIHLMCLP